MTTVQQFDFSTNLIEALLWQDDNTTSTKSLLQQKQFWYDTYQQGFWSNWYTDVFNLLTANNFGLAVWSIILGVPLYIPADSDDGKPLFGFDVIPAYSDYMNFDNGNFSTLNQVIFLTTEEQRLILRLKYFQTVSSAAIPEVNAFLNSVFNVPDQPFSGKVWVLDGLDMTITAVFNFNIPEQVLQVIQDLDLIPRAAGVKIKYLVLFGTPAFGFDVIPPYSDYENFDNGNFMDTGA